MRERWRNAHAWIKSDPEFSFCGTILLTGVSRAGVCSRFLPIFYTWPGLAAPDSAMVDLQESGICLRMKEQDKTNDHVWGRREVLSLLYTDGGTCVSF